MGTVKDVDCASSICCPLKLKNARPRVNRELYMSGVKGRGA